MDKKDISFYKNSAKYCFNTLKRYDLALEFLKAASSIYDDIEIKEAMVETYLRLEDFENAKLYAEKIISINGENPHYYFVLSHAYFGLYQKTSDAKFLMESFKNAECAYKKENKKLYLKTLIMLSLNLGDKDLLENFWMEFINKYEFDSDDKFDYGVYLLRKGNYKDGLKLYENRFLTNANPVKYPKINNSRYNGEDISNKTILIQAEQGIGDVIMFSRLLSIVQKKAKKLIFRAPEKIYEIIKRNFRGVEVLKMEDSNISDIKFDYHLPLISILDAFNIEKNLVLNAQKYLFEDNKKVAEFEPLFKKDKFKIGISYKSVDEKAITRNIPFEKFFPLIDDENEIYFIQYNENISFEKNNATNLSSKIKTFDDTMALISNMDLIISVDNVVLNLAGAMGKKTFGIYNKIADWRWFDLDFNYNNWYESVVPYRMESLNAFDSVIQKVKEDIIACKASK